MLCHLYLYLIRIIYLYMYVYIYVKLKDYNEQIINQLRDMNYIKLIGNNLSKNKTATKHGYNHNDMIFHIICDNEFP